jgi:hypothetical protein
VADGQTETLIAWNYNTSTGRLTECAKSPHDADAATVCRCLNVAHAMTRAPLSIAERDLSHPQFVAKLAVPQRAGLTLNQAWNRFRIRGSFWGRAITSFSGRPTSRIGARLGFFEEPSLSYDLNRTLQ